MYIETPRLLITDFSMEMCEAVHLNSLDEDNRRFVPDEVFETVEIAQEVEPEEPVPAEEPAKPTRRKGKNA